MIKNEIKLNFEEFITGIWDSLQVFSTFSLILYNNKISNNIINCVLLNGILLIGSMITYTYFIDPFVQFFINKIFILGYILLLGKFFYYTFWLIPIFIICNITTTFWTDEIYYESIELIEKRKPIVEGQDFVTNLSNQIERLVIIISFAIYIFIINYVNNFIPGLSILKFMTISILNSIYVFEYILLQKYIRNYKSIMYFIENKIFYFFGFGLLLTIIVNLVDSATINSSLFLMLFPFYLITSIKVNNIRFKNHNDLEYKNLRFLFLIEKFYDFIWRIISELFRCCLKRKRKEK